MARDTILVKTAKGVDEIKNRSAGLSMAQRRLLILADGKRSEDTIIRISRIEGSQQLLWELVQNGFLELPGGVQVRPGPGISDTDSELVQSGPNDLDEIKIFMTNTLQSFTNPMQQARLIPRIEQAASKSELKALSDEWYSSIADNPSSLATIDQLKLQLLELLV